MNRDFLDKEDEMIYVLWRAKFTLREIGSVFNYHPQEVKNIALKVAKHLKRLNTPPQPKPKKGI